MDTFWTPETSVTLVLVFIIGVLLLAWHRAIEECRRLRRGNMFLASELVALLEQYDPPRRTASNPRHWGDPVLDRIWQDIQAAPPLYDSHLHLIDPDMPEAS